MNKLPVEIIEEAVALASPYTASLDKAELSKALMAAASVPFLAPEIADLIALGAHEVCPGSFPAYDRAITTVLVAKQLPGDLSDALFPGVDRTGLGEALAALSAKVKAALAVPEAPAAE